MRTRTIKTIFLGKVALPEKFCERAKREREDLYLKVGNDLMTIRWNEIDMLGKLGKETYLDRFSNNFYRLCYFDWRPSKKQKELI